MKSPNDMSKRRSRKEIMALLLEFVENKMKEGEYEFFKTDVRRSKLKMHPDTAEEYFRIIEMAQKEYPDMEVKDIGDSTLIRIIDESETFIELIDRLVAEMNLSKETIAELISLRTRLKSGKTEEPK